VKNRSRFTAETRRCFIGETVLGGWRLAAGGWRLAAGGWRLAERRLTGNW
jgi:hypothetical protein